MKYVILYESFLGESKELDISNKYKEFIPDYISDMLLKIDRTKTKKYLNRIFLFFKKSNEHNNNDLAILMKIRDAMYTFDYLVNKKIIKGVDSDINKYDNIEELDKIVKKYEHVESNTLIKKLEKSNTIIPYKDEKKIILVPLDDKAAIIYGSGTKFCISSKVTSNLFYKLYFSDRGDQDNLCFVAFIIDKTLPTNNPLYKMAIQYHAGKETNILDSLNSESYEHCIEITKFLDIELPDDYHDTMEKYKDYKNYIKKHLKIDIDDLHDKIKKDYVKNDVQIKK